MSKRPQRIQITNEIGKSQTLAAGEEQFDCRGCGETILVLGVGPEPRTLTDLLPVSDVTYLECPEFESQMQPEWRESIPASWRRVDPADVTDAMIASSYLVFYRPGLRLFPSFWGPIWARAQALLLGEAPPAQEAPEVWMPCGEGDLLAREMAFELGQAGLSVRITPPDSFAEDLPRLLRSGRPRLVLSINFQGLDNHGETFHLLRAVGAEVAVWCVDNPFHLLTRLRSGFWRDVHLCVTDASFLEPLREHGAQRLLHLPLAAWPRMFKDVPPRPEHDLNGRMVYVGRSEFPRKRGFFAGVHLSEDAWQGAMERMDSGRRSDFVWWVKTLDISPLWPGTEVRAAGLGAEESGLVWRKRCLSAAASCCDLVIYGDEKWQRHLEGVPAEIRPEVDYYGPLGHIYQTAEAVLCTTSLLLPSGLNQRHFDVWAAGGFLLTDATPGLSIFPEELVREVRFEHPSRIEGMLRKLGVRDAERETLARDWKTLILAEHTYAHRARTLLDFCLD